MHFATNLSYLRRQRRLSQTTLGEHVGVDYATIGRYERGLAMPKLEIIARLAQQFGVSIEMLRDTDLTLARGPAQASAKPDQSVTPARPARHRITVAVELDGTTECLTRAFARLTAFNEVVAATD